MSMLPSTSMGIFGVCLLATGFTQMGMSFIWLVFALTLVVSLSVGIHRCIPRKER